MAYACIHLRKFAITSEKAKALLKVGFGFVEKMNGEYLYRKVQMNRKYLVFYELNN